VEQGKEHLVCKLKKAYYGLKQAPRSRYEKIESLFLQQGFMRSKSDPNLYTKFDEQGYIVLISLYVDDLIITGNVEKLIDEIKEQLSQVFKMKDLGELHYYLGLEVNSVLKRFKMDQCKSSIVPRQQNVKRFCDDGFKEVNAAMYR
jgi:hypothetical protein